jgi:hypothetical protein
MKQTGQVKGKSTDPQVAAVRTSLAEIHDAIESKNSNELYDLLSKQLTDVFPRSALTLAFSQLKGDTGMNLVGDPEINGEWAAQDVSYTNNGKTKTYTVVMHLENGEWKLFGTADKENS